MGLRETEMKLPPGATCYIPASDDVRLTSDVRSLASGVWRLASGS